MKNGKILCIICVLSFLLTAVSGCTSEEASDPKGKSYFSYFDTVSYVYSYAGDSAESFDALSAEASAVLGEYHRLFDIYHEYEGMNNLCTVNKGAGMEAVPVDDKLIDFLIYAKELYALTNGEFNIMLGSVLSIWHDCRDAAENSPADASLPSFDALSEAALHTDIELLEIDAEAKTVRISDPDASIDVGALGKGYATEMAAQKLSELGGNGYVLNVGGNIRIIGSRPDGTGWITGIKDPQAPDERIALKLNIKNISCVTSGVYERYFSVDGVRYHHIIDKDTLYPSDYYASLTVLTEDSGLADALSTALFCMTPDEGRAVIEKLSSDIEVLWIYSDGTMEYTDGFDDLIAE